MVSAVRSSEQRERENVRIDRATSGSRSQRVNKLIGTNTFRDPEFPNNFKKLVADDASPLDAEQLTKGVAEIPRDAETLDLLKKMSGAGPLPAR
jgi:ATP-dependent exoDNAse (exonuclease V) alpha subunit